MKKYLILFIIGAVLPVIISGLLNSIQAGNGGDPISSSFDDDENKLTISSRYDGECTLQQYDCNSSFYWTLPSMAEYCFMRFSINGSDTSLSKIYISLYQSQIVDTPDIDIYILSDDGTGFPDFNSTIFDTTISYSELSWSPNLYTLDITGEQISVFNDFHVGLKVNRSEAPLGALAITTDNGSCGSERSTIYRNDIWQHLRDASGTDYNFLIRATLCNFDFDGDSVLNDNDNCPNFFNPAQEDLDIDSVGDVCDNCPDSSNTNQIDRDDDGRGDVCDNCPDYPNFDQNNSDTDSHGDACDNCPNDDNEDQLDTDGDGLGDFCDTCPYDSLNDIDNDSLCAENDNCPSVYNPGQEDGDSDGIGDVCDECTDTDTDGYGNPGYPDNTCLDDNCPDTINPDQLDFDIDGIGDLCDTCTDTDGDGFGNPGYAQNVCSTDNCPTVYNPAQEDTDGDSIGDSCDVCIYDDENDIDNDGYCREDDNCHKTYNPDQNDTDGDGIGDACETRDSIFIDIGKPGQSEAITTLYSGFEYEIRLWFKNEVLLGGISNGFRFSWDSSISITWLSQPNGYGPEGQGTGLSCITVKPDTRMYPPDQVWDLGGFRIDEVNMDGVSPDTVLMGGVSFNGRFYPGELQHMISIHFKPEIPDGSEYIFCLDSCFVPPTGNFIFIDFEGYEMDVELNRDLCWTVMKFCGDANGDDMVNVGDAVFIINYAFKGGPAPEPVESGDANGDSECNVGDAVYIINYAFKGGPEPVCGE
ncbi:MAG: thrombospondin type 3 repeat-containing protein [candidate division Zixibacteria bacterium]|nr:thrombospondin type 3 repeat-containing protein [candidate division Zixibacteria bacterium]